MRGNRRDVERGMERAQSSILYPLAFFPNGQGALQRTIQAPPVPRHVVQGGRQTLDYRVYQSGG